MSKYLKADKDQHHYETIIRSEHLKEVNRINTFREMSNEYQERIQTKYAADHISHDDFGKAVHYYDQMTMLTKMCLLQIENNMISDDYEHIMKQVAKNVDKLEELAKEVK